MKKSLITILVILGLIIAIPSVITSVVVIKGLIQEPVNTMDSFQAGGAIKNSTKSDLIGSATNQVSLPNSLVEANATTTDASLPDGGQTLTQFVNFKGSEKLRLSGSAVGGTATSTAYIGFQGSNDGTNWFDITNATSTNSFATSTVGLVRSGIEFDPGTATTTFSYNFEFPAVDYLRVLTYGEDASTDPNDGVQMWLEAVKQQEL